VQLQQVAYFVAVADRRHFTQAAADMHVAQPSLSKQLAALEAELGAPLFNRARGNITLTEAGRLLLPLARRILADVESARASIQELVSLERGRVRLGATPSLATSLVPHALRVFRDQHPGVRLVLEQTGSRDLVARLAEGALDLALIILPLHTDDPDLYTVPVRTEPLVVALPPEHPLARRESLQVTDLRDEPLVMFREGYDLREVTLAACRSAGFEPVFAVEGGEMDAILRLVAAGLGVAIVPAMVAEPLDDIRRVPLRAPGLARTIAIAHRNDVALSNAANELRDLILDVASSAG